jgi:hypothetical protein
MSGLVLYPGKIEVRQSIRIAAAISQSGRDEKRPDPPCCRGSGLSMSARDQA